MDSFSRFVLSMQSMPSASSGATGRLCKTLLSMASLNAAKSDLWTVGPSGQRDGEFHSQYHTAISSRYGVQYTGDGTKKNR